MFTFLNLSFAIDSFLHCFKIVDFYVYVYHVFYFVPFIIQGSFLKHAFWLWKDYPVLNKTA